MSRAGRPAVRKALDELAAASYGPIGYVCRPEATHGFPGCTTELCARCDRSVVVTPSVLAEKRGMARAVGKDLEVLCDACALGSIAEDGRPIVAVMPSEIERAEARRIRAT